MSPTPEYLTKFQGIINKEQVLKGELNLLDLAITEIQNRLKDQIKKENKFRECDFFGFVLDQTGEIPTIHPIYSVDSFCGRLSFRVVFGKNFSFSTKAERIPSSDTDEMSITWYPNLTLRYKKGVVGLYPESRNLAVSGRTEGFIADLSSLNTRGLEKEVEIRRKIIVALANAAGIKPEDEESDNFPLLLEQLKRLKAEGKIC